MEYTTLLNLVEQKRYEEAQRKYPLDEMKRLSAEGDAMATFALAVFYYRGVAGLTPSLGKGMQFFELSAKQGFAEAKDWEEKWIRREKAKNIIGVVGFFEMCLCIPLFLVIATYFILNAGEFHFELPIAEKYLYISYVVPVVLGIVIIRLILGRLNLHRWDMPLAWGWVLPFIIPVYLAVMAIFYGIVVYALMLCGI